MRLENRIALVTGASSGIGREAARMMARQGAAVAITARRVERLEAVAEEIRAEGGRVLVLPGDVTDEPTTTDWVSKTVEKFGGLHVLVNSAGVIGTGTTADTPDDEWQRMFDVNFWSLMRLTRAAIPHLVASEGGSIIHISSVCSYRPYANVTPYCVSKAAVDMLTRCQALELADRRVRVNAINPGVVVSELHTAANAVPDYEAFLEHGRETHPLGRVGQPEDIGSLILYLASSESSWVTGSLFAVDGGRNLLSAR